MLYLQNYVVSRGSVVVNIYEFDMKTAVPVRHNETQNKTIFVEQYRRFIGNV